MKAHDMINLGLVVVGVALVTPMCSKVDFANPLDEDGENYKPSTVADTVKPRLVLQGDTVIVLPAGTAFYEPGYTATDNVDGTISEAVEVSDNIDTTTVGKYFVTYTVADEAGNTATRYRVVHVQPDTADAEAPVLTLTGETTVTIPVGGAYEEPGYTAVDNVDGDLTEAVVVTGSIDPSTAGTYTLSYAVGDNAGNRTMASRTIVVGDGGGGSVPGVDTTPPTMELFGENPLTITVGETYDDPGVHASDDVDGNITDRVHKQIDVNTDVAGTYEVSYTVTDNAGNTATTGRTVVVAPDTLAPELVLLGDNPLTLSIGESFVDPGASAIDAKDGDVSGAVTVSGADAIVTDRPGRYDVTYTVSDAAGNRAVAVRTVSVSRDVSGYTEWDGQSGMRDTISNRGDTARIRIPASVRNTSYGDTLRLMMNVDGSPSLTVVIGGRATEFDDTHTLNDLWGTAEPDGDFLIEVFIRQEGPVVIKPQPSGIRRKQE
jgi:hypothetical protein